MSLLPVVERELRVASRRPSAYWQRLGMAASGFALITLLLSIRFPGSPAQLSLLIFGILAYLMLLYCFSHGIGATADCFTSEKREGTLGLLFLTDLKGYDVVLGKLMSQSVQSLFNLLSMTPLMAIPVLMGGVSFDLFWRFSLGLVNFLFFSLSSGLLASAWCKTDRHARSTASGLVLMLTVGLPAICAIVCSWLNASPPPWMEVLLSLVNPLAPLIDAGGAINLPGLAGFFTKGFGTMRAYWPTLLTSHLLAWLFLLAASRIVPNSWQDHPKPSSRLARFLRWDISGKPGGRSGRRKKTHALLDANPVYWLCRRFYVSASPLRWAVALEAVFFLYLLSENGWDVFRPPLCLMIPLFAGATVKWAAASQAARPMIEQRRQGSLELLLATSLPVDQIIKGTRAAMNREFLPLVLLCLAIDIFFLMTTFAVDANVNVNSTDASLFFCCFVSGMVLLFIDYHAIVSLAMWHGLSSKKPAGASGTAVFGILVLPWMLWYGSILLYFIGLRRMTGPGPNAHWALAWWFFIGLSISCVLGATASVNLRNRFRECALERFRPEKPGLIERWAGIFKKRNR